MKGLSLILWVLFAMAILGAVAVSHIVAGISSVRDVVPGNPGHDVWPAHIDTNAVPTLVRYISRTNTYASVVTLCGTNFYHVYGEARTVVFSNGVWYISK